MNVTVPIHVPERRTVAARLLSRGRARRCRTGQAGVSEPLPSPAPPGISRIDRGVGEPVVLLHGVGLCADVWQPQIASLAQDRRVIALDLPGHGNSAPLPGQPGLGDYVDWTIAAIAALELGRVDLAGHSLGALIAAGVATRPDAPVRRLALLGPVYRRDAGAAAAVWERARQLGLGTAGKDAPITRWFSENDDEAVVERVRGYLRAVDPLGYAAAYAAFASVDSAYEAAYARIDVPTLVLTGAEDSNSTPQMSRALAALIPGAVVRILPRQRHMFGLTAACEVSRILLDWLEDRLMDEEPAACGRLAEQAGGRA